MEIKIGPCLVDCESIWTRLWTYRKLQSFDQTGNEKKFEPEVKKCIFRKLVKNASLRSASVPTLLLLVISPLDSSLPSYHRILMCLKPRCLKTTLNLQDHAQHLSLNKEYSFSSSVPSWTWKLYLVTFSLSWAYKNHNSLNNANQYVLQPQFVKIRSVKLEHLLSNWRDRHDFIFSDE